MPVRPGRSCWLRWMLLTTVMVAWGNFAPHPARAMGCHAPDRPEFGLTTDLDGPQTDAPLFAGASQLDRLPCSQDVPGALQTLSPLGALGLFEALVVIDTEHSRRLDTIPSAPRARHTTETLDPPPRRSADRV